MTHEHWTSGDAELTNALRALYAAPTEGSYWDALEARILARRLLGVRQRRADLHQRELRRDEEAVQQDEDGSEEEPEHVGAATLPHFMSSGTVGTPASPRSMKP